MNETTEIVKGTKTATGSVIAIETGTKIATANEPGTGTGILSGKERHSVIAIGTDVEIGIVTVTEIGTWTGTETATKIAKGAGSERETETIASSVNGTMGESTMNIVAITMTVGRMGGAIGKGTGSLSLLRWAMRRGIEIGWRLIAMFLAAARRVASVMQRRSARTIRTDSSLSAPLGREAASFKTVILS